MLFEVYFNFDVDFIMEYSFFFFVIRGLAVKQQRRRRHTQVEEKRLMTVWCPLCVWHRVFDSRCVIVSGSKAAVSTGVL